MALVPIGADPAPAENAALATALQNYLGLEYYNTGHYSRTLGHYAAMIRQEGDRYLLQDPTFGNEVWVTREALEAETSGYFLVPPGARANGWRAVQAQAGETVWGKGYVSLLDPKPHGPWTPLREGVTRATAIRRIFASHQFRIGLPFMSVRGSSGEIATGGNDDGNKSIKAKNGGTDPLAEAK